MPNPNGVPTLAELLGQANAMGSEMQARRHDLQKMEYAKELAKQQQAEAIQQAQNLVGQYSGEGKRVNVSLSPGGGVSLGEGSQGDDSIANLLKLLTIKNLEAERATKHEERAEDRETRKQDKVDKGAEKLGKTIIENKIPERQSAAQGLANSVQQKGVALGPYSGSPLMPSAVVALGEKLGLAKPGAVEQKKQLEAMITMVRHPVFGSSLSGNEKASADTAYGIITGSTPGNVQEAYKELLRLHNKAIQATRSTARPEELEAYQSRGGIPLEEIDVNSLFQQQAPNSSAPAQRPQPQQQPQVDPRRQRLEELRRKKMGR